MAAFARRLPIAAALAALQACAAPVRTETDADLPAPPAMDAADDDPAPARCRPAAGVSTSPGSIAAVVELVNALPHPVTLSCFLESLDRPLLIDAARGSVSLQPGVGTRSPRVFLFVGQLILSIVPEGRGSRLLELGEQVGDNRSVKAELAFPIEEPLAPARPFDEIRANAGTTCAACHPDEVRATDFAYAEASVEAYVSGAFRPLPRTRVSVGSLADERQRCDPAAEPARCAILGALFDHGEVRAQEFPAGLPTIFN
jgi:hypothetical protein